MKKKNRKCDYIDERNALLLREFKARLGTIRYARANSIFPLLAAEVKAPRFYINEDRALSLINKYLKEGQWPKRMSPNKQRMMSDILLRVNALRAVRSDMTLREAVYEVVNSEAPSLYLTPASMRTMLYASLAG